ncbi:MAG: hypothetical protein AAGG72_06350, partial [Pseudomonadota bacterium]
GHKLAFLGATTGVILSFICFETASLQANHIPTISYSENSPAPITDRREARTPANLTCSNPSQSSDDKSLLAFESGSCGPLQTSSSTSAQRDRSGFGNPEIADELLLFRRIPDTGFKRREAILAQSEEARYQEAIGRRDCIAAARIHAERFAREFPRFATVRHPRDGGFRRDFMVFHTFIALLETDLQACQMRNSLQQWQARLADLNEPLPRFTPDKDDWPTGEQDSNLYKRGFLGALNLTILLMSKDVAFGFETVVGYLGREGVFPNTKPDAELYMLERWCVKFDEACASTEARRTELRRLLSPVAQEQVLMLAQAKQALHHMDIRQILAGNMALADARLQAD